MPNGEKLDLMEIQLESRIIGDRDTHILNLKGKTCDLKVPKIIVSFNLEVYY